MRIDVDDSGMITLDEFFNYLRTDWSPFIGRAFHQMDSDQVGQSADQLSPDEWLIGLYNYCTLTPEALARFAFELYDDDGSEFISHDELETMVDDVFGKDFNKEVSEQGDAKRYEVGEKRSEANQACYCGRVGEPLAFSIVSVLPLYERDSIHESFKLSERVFTTNRSWTITVSLRHSRLDFGPRASEENEQLA